jgi:hypothetical protein
MQDEIDRPINKNALGNVLVTIRKTRRVKVCDVVRRTGDEIIDRYNFVSFAQATIA